MRLCCVCGLESTLGHFAARLLWPLRPAALLPATGRGEEHRGGSHVFNQRCRGVVIAIAAMAAERDMPWIPQLPGRISCFAWRRLSSPAPSSDTIAARAA